jgi:hypothetical protein
MLDLRTCSFEVRTKPCRARAPSARALLPWRQDRARLRSGAAQGWTQRNMRHDAYLEPNTRANLQPGTAPVRWSMVELLSELPHPHTPAGHSPSPNHWRHATPSPERDRSPHSHGRRASARSAEEDALSARSLGSVQDVQSFVCDEAPQARRARPRPRAAPAPPAPAQLTAGGGELL